MGNEWFITGKQVSVLRQDDIAVNYVIDRSELIDALQDKQAVDAVIVDGDMIAESLHELVAAIRRQYTKAPLLILASNFRMSAMAYALQAGFDEFMAKPVGNEELITLVKHKTNAKTNAKK